MNAQGIRTFITVWLGQTASMIGSGLTSFALGVWVYMETGSATRFALISVMASLPGLLVAPIAGALVDRWNRKAAMLISDSGAAVATLGLVALVYFDALEVWHIYAYVTFNSIFNTFQFPAFSAAATLLIPKQHLGRAAGMVALGRAISRTLAPAVAGVLLERFGLLQVIFADLGTFLIAVVALLIVTIPKPKVSAAGQASRGSLLQESLFGWTYIRERVGLVALLVYFAGFNLLVPMAVVLATPLVLSFGDSEQLGYVLAVGSAGTLFASLLMIAWGGPRTKIYGILGTAPLTILGLFLAGWQPSVPLIGAGLFLVMGSVPLLTGCSQAIWQSKVEHDLQGRVFAIRGLVAQCTGPIAFLLAGPLTDFLFEPRMAEGGAWAETFGVLVGVGPGRGIGLLFILLGLVHVVMTSIAWSYRPLRNLEADLPDAGEPDSGEGVGDSLDKASGQENSGSMT